jgi:hypothetical protein
MRLSDGYVSDAQRFVIVRGMQQAEPTHLTVYSHLSHALPTLQASVRLDSPGK